MKKRLFALVLSSLFLASCAASGTSSEANSDATGVWTISFDSDGGSEVAQIKVKNGEKAIRPTDPTKSGYSFNYWCVDKIAITPFDWDKAITASWTLYASWTPLSSSSVSSSSSSESEYSSSSSSVSSSEASSSSSLSKGHGPEGSSFVDYYLCGAGSLWESENWTIEEGVRLFSNPSSSSDKGCILAVPFALGDTFKVTDGTTWLGYDKVELKEEGTFKGANDGHGGQNIVCEIASSYNIYVNGQGNIWIEKAE